MKIKPINISGAGTWSRDCELLYLVLSTVPWVQAGLL